MHPYIAELLGTIILVLLGNGVVANVVLNKTNGNNGGWIVITAAWGFAVYVAAFCTGAYSGAHLNPALTIALAAAGKFEAAMVPGYIAAQLAGGIIGGMLVYLFYREHFNVTDNADAKKACFCTAPAIRNTPQSFFCEAVGTIMLVLPILLIVDPNVALQINGVEVIGKVGMGALGPLPVALLVFAIGLSLGGTTGYAINPARDLGPRIAHALLPIRGKRDSDWAYAPIPVLGPIAGGLIAVGIYKWVMTTA